MFILIINNINYLFNYIIININYVNSKSKYNFDNLDKDNIDFEIYYAP